MATLHSTVLVMVFSAVFSCMSGLRFSPSSNIPNIRRRSGQVACKKGQSTLHDHLRQAGIAAKSLEDRVKLLDTNYQAIQAKYKSSEQEIASLKRTLAQIQSKLNAPGWNLVRVDLALDQLAKIQLHQKTPTYIQQLPIVPPSNTKAIIISVFTNFWNVKGHVYLHFKTYQKRNARNGSVKVNNQHFNIYANTFYYELMLPWDTSLPDELVFEVKNSYLTGGNNNYYQVKLVGYITV